MKDQRERLIELLNNYEKEWRVDFPVTTEDLADHLLAEGVIVPPCKVGDTVYYLTTIDTDTELNVSEIFCGEVLGIGIENTGVYIVVHYTNGLYYTHKDTEFGKTVFLTKEEAMQALAKREDKR